jgi:sugar phosphate isomerase/epimerase
LRLSDDEVAQVKQQCDDYGVTVHCIGSPIGKSPLKDPIANELKNLERIMRVGEVVGARNIRIFSFYPPDTRANTRYDQHVDETIERLARLVESAARAGFLLLHENEKEIVGDTPERCAALIKGVDSPHLRGIWDPANYVQVGIAEQVTRYWDLLGPDTAYVHIKDALLESGEVRAAGEGDGQVKDLLIKLRDSGYQGVLSLEPHLTVAGHSGGFSGPEKMRYAVSALRVLLEEVGAPA